MCSFAKNSSETGLPVHCSLQCKSQAFQGGDWTTALRMLATEESQVSMDRPVNSGQILAVAHPARA